MKQSWSLKQSFKIILPVFLLVGLRFSIEIASAQSQQDPQDTQGSVVGGGVQADYEKMVGQLEQEWQDLNSAQDAITKSIESLVAGAMPERKKWASFHQDYDNRTNELKRLLALKGVARYYHPFEHPKQESCTDFGPKKSDIIARAEQAKQKAREIEGTIKDIAGAKCQSQDDRDNIAAHYKSAQEWADQMGGEIKSLKAEGQGLKGKIAQAKKDIGWSKIDQLFQYLSIDNARMNLINAPIAEKIRSLQDRLEAFSSMERSWREEALGQIQQIRAELPKGNSNIESRLGKLESNILFSKSVAGENINLKDAFIDDMGKTLSDLLAGFQIVVLDTTIENYLYIVKQIEGCLSLSVLDEAISSLSQAVASVRSSLGEESLLRQMAACQAKFPSQQAQTPASCISDEVHTCPDDRAKNIAIAKDCIKSIKTITGDGTCDVKTLSWLKDRVKAEGNYEGACGGFIVHFGNYDGSPNNGPDKCKTDPLMACYYLSNACASGFESWWAQQDKLNSATPEAGDSSSCTEARQEKYSACRSKAKAIEDKERRNKEEENCRSDFEAFCPPGKAHLGPALN